MSSWDEKRALTSGCPDGNSCAQNYLSPVQPIWSSLASEGVNETWPCWRCFSSEGCRRTGSKSRQVQTQSCDGEVCEGSREVIEALRLCEDRRDSNGCLDGKSSSYGRDEGSGYIRKM